LITSPQFHHWHHSNEPEAHNKNFAGELPVLDMLFGTFYLPENRTPNVYGVSERVPARYLRQMAYPFTRRIASDKY
jgi:sterol desaturase/sphingolipid hydroxylase (fatty acid hydroxylase superfamily)